MDWKKCWSQLKSLGMNTWYVHCYKHTEVDSHKILMDSRVGYARGDIGGNILRLTQELSGKTYQDYQVYVAYTRGNKKAVKKKLRKLHIRNVKLVASEGFGYYKLLAQAKYLFNDVTFPSRFIKKREQVYANTWHGTALKCLGKNIPDEAWRIGNTQKNFLMTDYIIQPSIYAADRLREAYNFSELYQGTYLYGGYPRNSIFFNKKRRLQVRRSLKLEGRKVYVYMPTWRGVADNEEAEKARQDQKKLMCDYFQQIDQCLGDGEVFFARLHPFVGNDLDFSRYRHVRTFPEEYDPYEIMNICDCLVTDYSSVFFDYANVCEGKIVLFCYDREEYDRERAFYLSLDELPFPKVQTVQELVEELRSPVTYDGEEFRRKYCTYDCADSARKVCRDILFGEQNCYREEAKVHYNGRKNLIFFMGMLQKNGIMQAYHNLLAELGEQRFNYFTAFDEEPVGQNPECQKLIPVCTEVFPMIAGLSRTYTETVAYVLRYFGKREWKWINQILDQMYERVYERDFGYARLDAVVQYTGYGCNALSVFSKAPCRKIVMVHNDMEKEMAAGKRLVRVVLKNVYCACDYVAAVSEAAYHSARNISGQEENLRFVHNCHNWKDVLARAGLPLELEEDSRSTVSLERLKSILESKGRKFISIGRFSAEKNHKELLKAFAKYHQQVSDSYLIILGSDGNLYESTVQTAQKLGLEDCTALIYPMKNPMPVLKACDLMIQPSLHEGLPMVFLEADTLGVPVISSNIPGPREFMKAHGGYLCGTKAPSIYKAMKAFDEGKVPVLSVDYEKWNQTCIREFLSLLE